MEREEKKRKETPKGTALMALVSLLLLTTFARPVIIAAFLVAQIQSSGCVSVDIKGRNAKSSFLFSSLLLATINNRLPQPVPTIGQIVARFIPDFRRWITLDDARDGDVLVNWRLNNGRLDSYSRPSNA